MKIGVAGAGAVGCLFGGLLHKAGHHVTFLSRDEHLKSMKEHGLTITGAIGTYNIRGLFTDDPKHLADSDLILFCVKSNDTVKMANQLHQYIENKNSTILTMQNGVDNEEVLSDIFGSQRILSSATYVQASIKKPGWLKQHGRIKVDIGELDSFNTSFCSQVVKEFELAGIDAHHVNDILQKKWEKLLWNITFNPLSAVVCARVGEILDNEELRNIAMAICKEALSVGQKLGYKFNSDETVAQLFNKAEIARFHQTSMLQDRIKGKRMEIESVCGYTIKKGKEFKVNTPKINAIYSILKTFDRKG